MGRLLTRLLLKGAGALVLLLVFLGIVSVLLSLLLGLVTTVITTIVTVAFLALLVLAVIGLYSLLGNDSADESEGIAFDTSANARDDDEQELADRLTDRYVAGDIDEAEFERQMELLLETSDTESVLEERETSKQQSASRTRTRLWER